MIVTVIDDVDVYASVNSPLVLFVRFPMFVVIRDIFCYGDSQDLSLFCHAMLLTFWPLPHEGHSGMIKMYFKQENMNSPVCTSSSTGIHGGDMLCYLLCVKKSVPIDNWRFPFPC